jgi:membrane protein YdbS with pleckstrin-like domain
MQMIDDWRWLWARLWSVRLSLVAGLLSAIETGMNLYATGSAPVIVVVAMVVSLAAAVARLVAQPKTMERSQ